MSDDHRRKEPGESTERRAQLEVTVDELARKANDLIDALMVDEQDTPPEEKKSDEGVMDAGPASEELEELDSRLDSLFGLDGDPTPVKEDVAAEDVEAEAPDAEVAAPLPDEEPAAEPELEHVPELEVAHETCAPPPTHGFRPSWMIAAAVLMAALAGGVWVTLFQDSPTLPHDEIVGATLQVLPLEQDPPARDDPIEVASVTTVKEPTVKPRVVNVEPPPPVKSDPPPPVVAKPAPVKPAPKPLTVEIPTLPTVADPAPSMLAPAIAIEKPTASAQPSPVAFPTVAGFQSPEALDRREPVWPADVETRGQPVKIVLKVLISEKGRVVRVVVESGVHDSKVEAAAINAVLHWTYAPAMDGGRPVRGWTTERFEF